VKYPPVARPQPRATFLPCVCLVPETSRTYGAVAPVDPAQDLDPARQAHQHERLQAAGERIAMLRAYGSDEGSDARAGRNRNANRENDGSQVDREKKDDDRAIRATGIGMAKEYLRQLIPSARVGHIGLYRNHDTLQPVDSYFRFRGGSGSRVLLMGPHDGARRVRGGFAVSAMARRVLRCEDSVHVPGCAPKGVKGCWKPPQGARPHGVLDREGIPRAISFPAWERRATGFGPGKTSHVTLVVPRVQQSLRDKSYLGESWDESRLLPRVRDGVRCRARAL